MVDKDEINYYCGAGPLKKGQVRAPPEYCVQNNQIRYYGIVAIDESLLKKTSVKSLIKEQIKLKKIEDKAKILIRDHKHLKIRMDNPDLTDSQRKKLDKEMAKLVENKNKLVKQLKSQKKIVEQVEEEERQRKKQAKKNKSK